MSSFDASLGIFSFLSYRDPHINETLQVFEEAQKFFSENEMTQDDMEKAIISAIGTLDKPMDPAGRSYVALIRTFSGATDELRQKFRNSILSATPSHTREILSSYFAGATRTKAVAVYSAQDKLEAANNALDKKLILESLTAEE